MSINHNIHNILRGIANDNLPFLENIHDDTDIIFTELILPKFAHMKINVRYFDYYCQTFETINNNSRQPFHFTLLCESEAGVPLYYVFCEMYLDFENEFLELSKWDIVCASDFSKLTHSHHQAYRF